MPLVVNNYYPSHSARKLTVKISIIAMAINIFLYVYPKVLFDAIKNEAKPYMPAAAAYTMISGLDHPARRAARPGTANHRGATATPRLK